MERSCDAEKIRGSRFIDRSGQRFGFLTILSFTRKNSRKQSFWLCRCDCGTEIEVFGGNLHSKHTTSCGCQKGFKTHGETNSPEYWILHGIISRCTNPTDANFYLYGAKGIKVCEQWDSLSKIVQFIKDVGRRPSPNLSIDRIDNKGDYEPGNVRWATILQQNSNTSRNVFVDFNGERLHLAEIARRIGVCRSVVSYRLKHGLSLA